MARTAQTTQPIGFPGGWPAMTAANVDGDAAEVGNKVFLLVNNASGAPITVTVVTPGTVDGDLAIADRTVSVPAAAYRLVPLSSAAYRQPATDAFPNQAYVNYSAVTSVTRAIVRLP